MNTALRHRGPDAVGTYHTDTIHLGHTLLSIRDVPEHSRQPVETPTSPWVLLFNGQIYNTEQLKRALGLQHDVTADTTILFKTIERHSWNFIRHIHGMYAIVLYNRDEKIVRLYRDPSGQKVLYYYHKGGAFIFSSEIKAILKHPHIDRNVDYDAVTLAAHFGYIPGHKTLFTYIGKVNPSECITFDIVERTLSKAEFESDAPQYFSENMSEAFSQLVREHLQSREQVTVNLSGGLDSSLLVYEMAHVGYKIETYTTHFETDEISFNEDAGLAKRLAREYGTQHHEIPITKSSYFDNFIESYRHIEEPNFNISLPIYLQTAKAEGADGDKHRVVLSGDGGDEIFGGYPYYRKNIRIDRLLRMLTPSLFNLIKNHRNNTDVRFEDVRERWFFFRDFYQRFTRSTSFDAERYVKSISEAFFHMYQKRSDSIYQCMLMDRLTWLANENFIRSDKLFMSETMELRSPLAYHPFRLYIDAKLPRENPYFDRQYNKTFLRGQYDGKLPDYIVHRKTKTGWRAPIAYWYDARFKKLFLEILSPMQGGGGVVDWHNVTRQVEQSDGWPGKYIHLYLSLAILAKEYKLDL
jgi:asparagine synthase (glutamine-hydrolysing)